MRAAIRQILFGETPFSPRRLFNAGEQGVFFDPSDFSTLFQDSGGTTPVTAVEQPVGLILDKSGRGNHASQSSTTSRPILRQEAGGQYYLAFDGVDDFLVTGNIDFSATDKMSVFAGVRKLSDATQNICEFAVVPNGVWSTSNGGFVLHSGITGSTDIRFAGHGDAAYNENMQAISSTQPAPRTVVVSGLGDIPGDLNVLRINGALSGSGTSDQGAGKYGNYPLTIGARQSSPVSLFLHGRIYSLIIRGALTSSPQLEQTERWVAAKTGVTL